MELIDLILEEYRLILKNDYMAYKNHVYRIFSHCKNLDDDSSSIEKYAIAAAFHDLGLWVNKTFDYINPSIALAENYLKQVENECWITEITAMIQWHHKITTYQGLNFKTVEVFRKADLMDLSCGLFRFGIKKSDIKDQIRDIPRLGFHIILFKMFLRNLLKEPLNPLPMLKW